MARRQLVTGGINLGLYAAAGKPQNLVGEAIAGIGSVIGEAIAEGKDKTKKLDDEEKTADQSLEAMLFPGFADPSQEIKPTTTVVEDVAEQTNASSVTSPNVVKDTQEGGGLASYKKAWATNLEGIRGMYPSFEAYVADPAIKGAVTEAKRSWAEINLPKGTTYNEAIHGAKYAKSLGVKSPVNRIARGRRSTQGASVNNFANVMGRSSTNSVITTPADRGEVSTYNEDRTYVKKMRKMSAPSWMGVGAAAAEGWNLGAERINYRKQVQADLQDYYEDQFAGLEAPESGLDYLDASLKEVAFGAKQDMIKHLQERDQWFNEGRGAEWSAKMSEKRKLPASLAEVAKKAKNDAAGLEELVSNDAVDFDAMGPAQTDEALTFLRGGSILGLAQTEEGNIVLGGKTRGGMGYVKDMNYYLKGGGPKVIEKKNAFDYVSSVVESFRKNQGKYEKTVIDPATGIKKTVPMSFQEVTPYLTQMFDAELDSESITRAYASPSNWDEDGMSYDAFNSSIKLGKNPKDFVKGKFLEVAQQMLTPYLGQYEEISTGLATAKFNEQAKVRAERRKKQLDAEKEKQSGANATDNKSGKDIRTAAQKNADMLSNTRSLFADNILGIFSKGLDINKAEAAGEPAYDLAKTIPGIRNAYEENGVLILTDKNDDIAYRVDLTDYRKAKQKIIEIQAEMRFKPEKAGLRTANDLRGGLPTN